MHPRGAVGVVGVAGWVPDEDEAVVRERVRKLSAMAAPLPPEGAAGARLGSQRIQVRSDSGRLRATRSGVWAGERHPGWLPM